MQVIASSILNEKHPRQDNYWALLGIIVVNIFVAVFLLSESMPKAKDEEDQITGKVKLFSNSIEFRSLVHCSSGSFGPLFVAR